VRADLTQLHHVRVLDEFEQPLKSITNYTEALEHIIEISPELEAYMKKYSLFFSGDWPTWYYTKKIICQVGIILV